jgi:putative FmdB family regulatory protein
MPTYVYECAKCGDEFELYQSFSDEPLKKHEACGGKVSKVFQPVGIVLKGSGFYKNDNRGSKRSTTGAKTESGSSGSEGSSSDATSSTSTKSDGTAASTKKSDSSSTSKTPSK